MEQLDIWRLAEVPDQDLHLVLQVPELQDELGVLLHQHFEVLLLLGCESQHFTVCVQRAACVPK